MHVLSRAVRNVEDALPFEFLTRLLVPRAIVIGCIFGRHGLLAGQGQDTSISLGVGVRF